VRKRKEKKRWSELRESKSLDEEIEDDRSTRKTDCGQLSKWKKTPVNSLEHHARKKER
jgi:hypothetical protein